MDVWFIVSNIIIVMDNTFKFCRKYNTVFMCYQINSDVNFLI